MHFLWNSFNRKFLARGVFCVPIGYRSSYIFMTRSQSSSGIILLADKFEKLRPPHERRGGHFGHLRNPIGMAAKFEGL